MGDAAQKIPFAVSCYKNVVVIKLGIEHGTEPQRLPRRPDADANLSVAVANGIAQKIAITSVDVRVDVIVDRVLVLCRHH